jgi:chromosome segregation ATPase
MAYQVEGTVIYKGYTIVHRNAAMGGVRAVIQSERGQILHEIIETYREEATMRAKTWIDNQDESDAELFLGSLAQRDQDVDRLERELADAVKRINELQSESMSYAFEAAKLRVERDDLLKEVEDDKGPQRITDLEAQLAAWQTHADERLSLFYACKSAIEVIADLDAEETDAVFTKLLNAIRLVEPGFNLDETVVDQRIDDEGDPS